MFIFFKNLLIIELSECLFCQNCYKIDFFGDKSKIKQIFPFVLYLEKKKILIKIFLNKNHYNSK